MTKLTFRADVNGRPFGVIVFSGGLATARAGQAVLADVLLSHAVLWMQRQNPVPGELVCLQLVGHVESPC